MTGTITHRGPDDSGYFVSDQICLGMRRLSVIDVAGGHQPIFNEDRTLAIVFNGEIYNYQALVDELLRRGHRFSTRSDTETILHLYEEYGPGCVDHLRGMFTIAICDTRRNRLFLARDRFGIKPLYYWLQGRRLLFASEIKALLASETVPREPNLVAIDHYLSLRYVPGPETMFVGVRKLPAAHWLIWEDGEIRCEQYWSPQPHHGSYQPDDYYEQRFAELFTDSVRSRLMSEVPLGAFLSGGVDSTAIVATMSRISNQPVKTFSVGFDWHGDEVSLARESAQRLGCDHHEIMCRAEDVALIPKIVWHLDEPVGDAIVLPMYLLSRLARQHVTVIVAGEGADETLAGYLMHKVMFWAGQYARRTPRLLHEALIRPIAEFAPTWLMNLAFAYPAALGDRGRRRVLDYLSLLPARQPQAEYELLISLFDARDKAELYDGDMRPFLNGGLPSKSADVGANGSSYLDQILSLQYEHWLPDDILTKQDKMTMASSIEGREVFLDHPLVEFLLQTPPHLKLRGLMDKVILRRYLAEIMPGQSARRRKKAFYIPLDQYLGHGPLREMTESCLSEASVRRRGYFKWGAVRALRESVNVNEFLFGKQIFSLLALELWHRIFIDREPGWV